MEQTFFFSRNIPIANFLRFSITYFIIYFRDYIKRRMRFAEGMWEIALKHESYIATEMDLKERLEIQRLDFGDRYQAGGMAILEIFKTLNSSKQLGRKN